MATSKARLDVITDVVSDLVSDFLYYDRKEDEDLPRGAIQEAIAAGEITVEDILKHFERELRAGLRASDVAVGDSYTEREMRLMRERDEALSRAEKAERDLKQATAAFEREINDVTETDDDYAKTVERDTAEAIAVWLDTKIGAIPLLKLAQLAADIRAFAWKTRTGTTAPSTSRRDKERSLLPCPDCGEHHLLDQFSPGMRVTVDGRPGRVIEWSQYGGPLYVRVEFDNRDHHGNPFRDNFNPCELRAEGT